jgi:S-methylmethionine-dependent homocysteine/selenocysteine methylase
MELRRSLQLTVRALALSQRISLVKMSAAASSAASLSYKSSEERLAHLVENPNEILILDGGTGEELFVRGVPDDRKIWSATAVVHDKYHATLVEVHKSFLRAGAQAVTTNSYGVTPGVGFDTDEIKKYCSCAGKLARQAVSEEPGNALVLGSLGPLVESYRADLVMEHDAGAAVYKSMVASLAPFVDCFLGETMSSVEETMQVVDAVASMSSDTRKPCLVSYSLDSDGNLRSGEPPVQAIPRILAYSEAHCVKGKLH